MPEPLAKLMPSIVLIAILGYLGWSYLDMAPAPSPPPGKLPQIAADQLRPEPPEATTRDPFGNSVRFELGEVVKDERGERIRAKATADSQTEPQKKPQAGGAAVAAVSPPVPTTRTATSGLATGAAPPSSKPLDTDDISEFVLNGTMLFGPFRVALINGRTYRTGDPLESSSSDAPCKVAEIRHHDVVLERDGKTVKLEYRNSDAGSEESGEGRQVPRLKIRRAPEGAPRTPVLPGRPMNQTPQSE